MARLICAIESLVMMDANSFAARIASGDPASCAQPEKPTMPLKALRPSSDSRQAPFVANT
jgi:hypothetical protein